MNDVCEGALPLELGETIQASTRGGKEELRRLDTCFIRDVGNPAFSRPGVWFTIDVPTNIASSQRLRINACNGTRAETAPIHLSLYESDNNACDILTCAVVINHVDCALEFEVPATGKRQDDRQIQLTYKLLVQQSIPISNFDTNESYAGGVFLLSLFPVEVPSNDDCLRAQNVDVGTNITTSALSATPESMDTVRLCERDNGDMMQQLADQYPAPGVWYRMLVGGRIRLLATACNGEFGNSTHVTVYTGSCNNLRCLSDSQESERACEAQWDATSSESVYFILVERVLADGNDAGEFQLSIDLLFR